MKTLLKEKRDGWEITIKDFFVESEIAVKMDKELSNFEMETVYNKLMELSGANRKDVVGPISKIFAKYVEKWERNGKEISVKGWKEYYLRNHKEKYLAGKQRFIDFVVKFKSKEISSYGIEVTEIAVRSIAKKANEYFDNLIFVKTCKGLYIENAFGKAVTELGYSWTKNFEDESLGIDGYINSIPVSIKPESYRGDSDYTGVSIENIASYKKSNKDLVFSLNFNLNSQDGN